MGLVSSVEKKPISVENVYKFAMFMELLFLHE